MQTHKWPLSPAEQRKRKTPDPSRFTQSKWQRYLASLLVLPTVGQLALACLERSPVGVAKALFEHPAVSSLGCDVILSLISYLCWITVARRGQETSKRSS